MSIYKKLPKARKLIGEWEKTKSGNNRSFQYAELADISPAVDSVCEELGICYFFNISKEEATITLVDAENPEITIVSSIPLAPASLKGCTPVQEMGALVTYARRYLLLTAFNISVPDQVDSRGLEVSRETAPKQEIHLNLHGSTKPVEPLKSVLVATEQDVTDVALALVDKSCVRDLMAYWNTLPAYEREDQRIRDCFKDAREALEAKKIEKVTETGQPLH